MFITDHLLFACIATTNTSCWVMSCAEEGQGQTQWYVDPPTSGEEAVLFEKGGLSTSPKVTSSVGLHQSMLAALGRSDPISMATGSQERDASSARQGVMSSPEKKTRVQPKGTLEYKVRVGVPSVEPRRRNVATFYGWINSELPIEQYQSSKPSPVTTEQ